MNYKLLYFVLVGLFIAVPLFAQKDAKAKAILDKTSDVINRSGGLSVSFTFHINDEARRIKESFEGQILLKGDKFFLDTPEQTVYFDGKTQWVYVKSTEEVNILEPQPQDLQALNPISIFELYKTDCDYKYKGVKTDIQKRKAEEVSLFPKKKNETIKQVDMQINPDSWLPSSFRITNKDKSEYLIYINKYQTKQDFPDSQFVFDKKKYPQAEINDLR
jgi:outer membrane lipoprotein-sorting protein